MISFCFKKKNAFDHNNSESAQNRLQQTEVTTATIKGTSVPSLAAQARTKTAKSRIIRRKPLAKVQKDTPQLHFLNDTLILFIALP
jgi:hypothetical protein